MNDEIRMSNDELPEGWATVPVQELGHVQLGKMLDRAKNSGTPTAYLRNINVRWFEFDLSDLKTVLVSDDERERFSVLDGDLFICEGGEPGRSAVWKSGKSDIVYQKALHRFRTNGAILPDLLMYRFRLEAEAGSLHESFSGSTIKHFTRESLVKYKVPLPPLPEQKRIADKLEAVLGRVDACRARLDRVPALLKRFRQSVLAAATSGKLTEEWRDANECGEDAASLLERMAIERRAVHAKQGKNRKFREAEPVASEELPEIPKTWQWTNFDHCSSEISVGHVGPMKDRYVDKGVAFLRCQNVRPLRFNPHGLVCIPKGFHKELSKSELCGGEILVVRSGANTGDCCVFPCGFGEANCSDLVITRPLSGLSSEYGAIYVNSPTGQSLLDQKQAGVAQPHFNIGAMRVKAFPLAPFAEQQEIVRRVEDLFAFADRIEARLAVARKTVERLTPSVLAKAFRGELVSQDPNDEPASTLLERLNKQPVAKPARKTRAKRQ